MVNSLDVVSQASATKRRIGRSLSVNGVHAVDIDLKKSQNLADPIIDVNLKVNNPVGRLWLALKRLWKSQSTVIDFKVTIPLIVIPVIMYVGWALWQGRGVSTPMSKLGVIHQVTHGGEYQDLLILPGSDVYTLSYTSDFDPKLIIYEKPVIVVGTYKHISNTFYVDLVMAYNPADIIPSTIPSIESRTMWDRIWVFLEQFK